MQVNWFKTYGRVHIVVDEQSQVQVWESKNNGEMQIVDEQPQVQVNWFRTYGGKHTVDDEQSQ